MQNVGIIIGSRYGQTEKIGKTIQKHLQQKGINVSLWNLSDGKDQTVPLRDFDGVIIGAPVYGSNYPSPLVKFVRSNNQLLNTKTCAFFSVSLNAADGREKAREADNQLIEKFLKQTKLEPAFRVSFAGALKYREYNFFMRWIMKRITKSAGGPTDTSRDYEMTDWVQVKAFAEDFFQENRRSPFAA